MSTKFQDKLLQYEVKPPQRVWQNIVTDLDEGRITVQKLRLYEKNPPAPLWNKIIQELEKQNVKAKTIPFYQRYSRPLKYSGTIAAFIMLALITTLLIGKRSTSEGRTLGTLQTKMINAPKESLGNNFSLGNTLTEATADKKGKIPPFSRKGSAFSRIINIEPKNILTDINNILPKFAIIQNHIDYKSASDQYIVFSDDNGHAMRLSKKLYDIFSCPFSDNNCHTHIQKLQEKTATSALASDFTGILEILSNLNENQ